MAVLDFAPAGSQADRLWAGARAPLCFAAVLALFALVTAIFFWPVLPHLSSALLGPPEDNMNDLWNSWYATQPHDGGFFFTRLIRFPQGTPLNYQSFAYPQVMTVMLLRGLFAPSLSGLILLQNLTLLAAFPLAGAGAFYLCRHLTGNLIASLAGGFLFAFNPAHVAQAMHHAHVEGIEFLPFFVLAYLLALERRSAAWLAAAAVFYALSALYCWYYLFYGFYFLAFHTLYLRVHNHRWPRGWPLIAPLLCVAATLALVSPLLVPMLTSGLHGDVYYPGSNRYVADLMAYTAFPPTHLLGAWTRSLYAAFTGNAWEDTVYLGLVNLGVLGWALWRCQGPQRRILFYAIGGMIFFCVLASGEALHVGGHTTPIYLPGVVLARLPFFANTRTPARAIVFVYLFLSLAIAGAATTALRGRRGPASTIALTVAAILMLLDFYPARLDTTTVVCAPELGVIAQDPQTDFGILDLPTGYLEGNFAMMQQACHGRPIAQGEIARKIGLSLADRLEIQDFAAQRRQLTQARVKYILLHRPRPGLFPWKAEDGEWARYRQAYPVVADGADMTVLKVY